MCGWWKMTEEEVREMVRYLIEIPDDWGEFERQILREEVEKLIKIIEHGRKLRKEADAE